MNKVQGDAEGAEVTSVRWWRRLRGSADIITRTPGRDTSVRNLLHVVALFPQLTDVITR